MRRLLVSCERAHTVVHAYFDNELDALSAAEFERHLKECSECAAALASLQSLRSSMRDADLYEKTPPALRKKVLGSVGSVRPISIGRSGMSWRWLAVAAAILLFASVGWQIASQRHGDNGGAVLAAEAIDAHLRSLQPGHLTDVVSSDQHTVKPWFDGKLDFAPPVRDFADRGFPLLGGRLDVVHGRTIAAVVYGRRKHVVNVFIWPTSEKDAAARTGSQQGYQWIDWRTGGMEFCAVSDAALSDLQHLQSFLAN
jgi:anti-sigma factor RsiW